MIACADDGTEAIGDPGDDGGGEDDDNDNDSALTSRSSKKARTPSTPVGPRDDDGLTTAAAFVSKSQLVDLKPHQKSQDVLRRLRAGARQAGVVIGVR